jgi:16S rRNA (guanine527-N7)-methyltransferase
MTDAAKGALSRPLAGPDDFAREFAVSRETLDRLTIYARLLTTWQRTMNLVAPRSLPDLWRRHMADSAQLVELAPAAGHWVDFGSGAGFPGLVVAILGAQRAGGTPSPKASAAHCNRDDLRVTLVESDQRKCAFLAEVVRKTGISGLLAVEILCQRVESPAIRAKLAAADVVSARAVAPLAELLGLSAPLFGPSTIGLFPKGRSAAVELEDTAAQWAFEHLLHRSRTDRDGTIIEIRRPRTKTEG